MCKIQSCARLEVGEGGTLLCMKAVPSRPKSWAPPWAPWRDDPQHLRGTGGGNPEKRLQRAQGRVWAGVGGASPGRPRKLTHPLARGLEGQGVRNCPGEDGSADGRWKKQGSSDPGAPAQYAPASQEAGREGANVDSWGPPRAPRLLPGERAGAAIGSRVLPRALKLTRSCNLQRQSISALLGPLVGNWASLGQVSSASSSLTLTRRDFLETLGVTTKRLVSLQARGR